MIHMHNWKWQHRVNITPGNSEDFSGDFCQVSCAKGSSFEPSPESVWKYINRNDNTPPSNGMFLWDRGHWPLITSGGSLSELQQELFLKVHGFNQVVYESNQQGYSYRNDILPWTCRMVWTSIRRLHSTAFVEDHLAFLALTISHVGFPWGGCSVPRGKHDHEVHVKFYPLIDPKYRPS